MEIGANGVQCRRELASGDVHTYAYDAFGNITGASTAKATVKIPHTLGQRVGDIRNGRGIAHRWRGGVVAETTYFGRFIVTYEALAPGDTLIHLPAGKPIRMQRTKDDSVLRCLGNGTNELSRFDPLQALERGAGSECMIVHDHKFREVGRVIALSFRRRGKGRPSPHGCDGEISPLARGGFRGFLLPRRRTGGRWRSRTASRRAGSCWARRRAHDRDRDAFR